MTTRQGSRRTKPRPENGAEPEHHGGLALLFPGQGSQRAGMGKRIADLSEAARKVFAEADDVLDDRISHLCFEGTEAELEDTVNTQPAMLTTSLAHLAYLRERLQEMGKKLVPSFMAGHSLGQFSAAVAANSIDLSDGLRLVQERGRIMADWARTRPGGLAAVLGMKERAVRDVCREASNETDGTVSVAVLNSEDQTVIAGELGPLERAMALARERGAKVRKLPISVPSHTPLMRDAARELSRFIDKLPFRDPNPPLVSNITAKLLTTAEEVREDLSNQICAAVQWARCVVALGNEGANPLVEVGPGQALSNLVRRIRGDIEVFDTETASVEDLLRIGVAVPVRASSAPTQRPAPQRRSALR